MSVMAIASQKNQTEKRKLIGKTLTMNNNKQWILKKMYAIYNIQQPNVYTVSKRITPIRLGFPSC